MKNNYGVGVLEFVRRRSHAALVADEPLPTIKLCPTAAEDLLKQTYWHTMPAKYTVFGCPIEVVA